MIGTTGIITIPAKTWSDGYHAPVQFSTAGSNNNLICHVNKLTMSTALQLIVKVLSGVKEGSMMLWGSTESVVAIAALTCRMLNANANMPISSSVSTIPETILFNNLFSPQILKTSFPK